MPLWRSAPKLDLPAPELWLLARLGERLPVLAAKLNVELKIKGEETRAPLDRLCRLGYLEESETGALALTADGRRLMGA